MTTLLFVVMWMGYWCVVVGGLAAVVRLLNSPGRYFYEVVLATGALLLFAGIAGALLWAAGHPAPGVAP